MRKALLILGVLLTLANNASSSGTPQPIPPEPDKIISSLPKKAKKESEVLDRVFAQNTSGDSGESQGREIIEQVSKNPYWAYGKPLLPAENTKAPKALNYSQRVKQNNLQLRIIKALKRND